jgi:hypothetical protein
MDALARRALAREARPFSAYHNENISSGSTDRMSPANRRPSTAPIPTRSSQQRPSMTFAFNRSLSRPALSMASSAPQLHQYLHPVMPGPGQYAPALTATGKEFDLADLNGAEKMQMSSCTYARVPTHHTQPRSSTLERDRLAHP